MKTFKHFFESVENNQIIVYHITRRSNLPLMYDIGIIPKIPEDYGENGDNLGIYCFPEKEDAVNAMWNWMGERIEDWEEETGLQYDEVLLKLDVTGLDFFKEEEIDWEIIILETIPPDRILAVEEI